MSVRVSQSDIEVLLQRTPNLRVSQSDLEVLLAPTLGSVNLRVSQIAIEVLIKPAARVGRSQGPAAQMM